MDGAPSPIKRDILLRVRVLYAAFFLVGAVLLVRLVGIQFFSSSTARAARRMTGRIFTEKELRAHRGDILLRGGEPLATSIVRYQVEIDYSAEGLDSVEQFRYHADSLARLLGRTFGREGYGAPYFRSLLRSEYARRHTKAHYMGRLLPHPVDRAEWEQLRRYPILNLSLGLTYRLEEIPTRIYPQGQLALRTVGKVNAWRGNEYGVEHVLDSLLRGEDGRVRRQRIAHGYAGRVADSINVQPRDGYDVVLTIDRRIQEIADEALRERLEYEHALWGTALVMDVRTGELLAMSNLSERADGTYAEIYENALRQRMNPGSTFKLVALLALLEEKEWSLDRRYATGNGRSVEIDGRSYQDAHPLGDTLTMLQAMALSSNTWFVQAIREAYRDDPRPYIEFMRRLHLDRPMGLRPFGEMAPLFFTADHPNWRYDRMLNNLAYGYTIELVPLQTLALYNAVANDGCLVAPQLVREIRSGDRVVQSFEREVLCRRIASSATLEKVRACLEATASWGTAREFFARDSLLFRAAAKTGTAQVSRKGITYRDGYYLGSMVAYFPADEPRYTVMAAVETRRGRGPHYYGASVAGPVVRRIVESLYNLDAEWRPRVAAGGESLPSHVKGGDLRMVRRAASGIGAKVKGDGRGWGTARVEEQRVHVAAQHLGEARMPDVVGMGLRDALFLCEQYGLRVSTAGHGRVVRQSIPAGRPLSHPETIILTMK